MPTKREIFNKGMDDLATLHSWAPSVAALDIYWRELSKHTEEEITYAMLLGVRRCEEFPKLAKLLEFIRTMPHVSKLTGPIPGGEDAQD